MSQRFSKYYYQIPVLLGIAMLLGVYVIGRSFFTFNLREIKSFTDITSAQIAIRLDEQLNAHLNALYLLRDGFSDHDVTSRQEFQTETEHILTFFKGFQAINFIDTTGIIRWVTPLEGNEMVVNRDLHTHEFANTTFQAAEDTRRDRLTPPLILWQGGMGLATYLPIIHDGRFRGYLNGVIRFNNFLEAYLHEGNLDQFHIAFEYKNTTLYEVNGFPTLPSLKLQSRHPVKYHDKTLMVSVSPHQSLINHFKSPATIFYYITGILVSLILPTILFIALRHQAALHDSYRALEASETRYRDIFTQSHDAIYRTTLDGVLTIANPAALTMLGITEDQLGKINVTSFYRQEEDRRELVRRILAEGQVTDFAVPLILPDGRHLDGLLSATAVWDDGGQNISGIQGIVQDITRLKQQEQDLKAALKREKEARQVITNIVFNLSHEIRTPLNSILGYAEMLKDSLEHQLDEEHLEAFQVLKANGHRLSRTISEILDYASVSGGDYDMMPEKVNVETGVQQALKEYDHIIQVRQNNIHLKTCGDNGIIWADKYIVKQVIYNLIHNALVFTYSGEVHITLSPLADGVRLRIQDTGIGMKPGFQDRMFDLFAQESTGLDRKFEGLGLGLSLVKLYVDRLQGTVTIESEWGQGTVAIVELPRASSAIDSTDV
ncbi:MAG: ATP-binding protein [Fidelibacterota bacterium]